MATAHRLTDVLIEQTKILKELQQTLQDEQKAIAALNTQVMEALNSQKEQLIQRQRLMTETLHGVLSATAVQYGLASSSTLSEVIEKMPLSIRGQVEPLQQAARQAGLEVSVLANQNRGMLERFLGVVNDSLGFILRILNTSNTYGVRGTYLSNAQSGAVMVSKEA
ncbi:FlgN protein [Trichlorobacter thiogenes]|uniref:FlgN protein n=1 Tax=Trichlorobacter thiogenes TaxID=115783 RepID=A0A1T4JSK9_9BACT|nr:flagellar protein FlgN [Trichlorobacter thiogenes]SJZ33129.1 FlgN protein [Trichlorobacter thiogenes]